MYIEHFLAMNGKPKHLVISPAWTLTEGYSMAIHLVESRDIAESVWEISAISHGTALSCRHFDQSYAGLCLNAHINPSNH